MEYQTENSDKDQPAATYMPASEAETAATSTLIAPVFNIVADATRSPFHATGLPDLDALDLNGREWVGGDTGRLVQSGASASACRSAVDSFGASVIGDIVAVHDPVRPYLRKSLGNSGNEHRFVPISFKTEDLTSSVLKD